MWLLTRLSLAGALTLFFFQNPAKGPDNKSQPPGASSNTKTSADKPETVAPGKPVITVHGVCDTSNAKAPTPDACVTVVTREQFENLEQALHPGSEMPAKARNNLAKLYAEYITIEAATRKTGVEDTAEFREFTNWMRVLAASEYYRRQLQQKYSNPSQQEIDAYYREHLAEYEKVKVLRVLIPRANASAPNADEFDRKAHEAAKAAQANLVTGMDATQVQMNAYLALGLQGPPPVDLGTRRRKDFLGDEASEVFSLKAGEVTQVQTEPKNYVIYKVVSRETTPEEDLQKSISAQITETKFSDTMKALVDKTSVNLNEQYFGPPDASDNEPRISPHAIVTH